MIRVVLAVDRKPLAARVRVDAITEGAVARPRHRAANERRQIRTARQRPKQRHIEAWILHDIRAAAREIDRGTHGDSRDDGAAECEIEAAGADSRARWRGRRVHRHLTAPYRQVPNRYGSVHRSALTPRSRWCFTARAERD